ncbi:hypothetical protein CAPTEDRAFT_220997 [Capitella teleta]|uniref:Uncharacterized protein n=1 Tax=Capitella teleta TaxID=283909 RepID=R7TAV4_CAPTE|nr:hypothetical protein CAPTEDRAFT_220997 [Capitella teleta]|eukprot:ELT90647.1 hypothetical protein CAPTEDRAFT_220997 [Capitella teleta]
MASTQRSRVISTAVRLLPLSLFHFDVLVDVLHLDLGVVIRARYTQSTTYANMSDWLPPKVPQMSAQGPTIARRANGMGGTPTGARLEPKWKQIEQQGVKHSGVAFGLFGVFLHDAFTSLSFVFSGAGTMPSECVPMHLPKLENYQEHLASLGSKCSTTPGIRIQGPKSNVVKGNARQNLIKSVPYRPFEDNNRNDAHYSRYLSLSQNVAQRYPNPGPPRYREGAIGGNWRHIKEVLGHSGSRVIFVDGLVSLEDTAHRLAAHRVPTKLTPAHSPYYKQGRPESQLIENQARQQLDKDSFSPWKDKIQNCDPFPAIQNAMKERFEEEQKKYKGFYAMN